VPEADAIPIGGSASWCGACGHVGPENIGMCPVCGAPLGRAVRGAIVEMPPGAIPCAQCGRRDVRVVFRGWSRLYAFIYWARETRLSAYLCVDCARKQTITSLLMTAFLGWWSFPSLWHGPKATYFNWRSVWAPPYDSLSWGAVGLNELLESASGDGGGPQVEDDTVSADSPLVDLTITERHMVINADDPYGALGISIHATDTEIKAAWRDRAKASHPDVNPGDANAAARMLALNQAYEILGNPRLRKAYDWFATHGEGSLL